MIGSNAAPKRPRIVALLLAATMLVGVLGLESGIATAGGASATADAGIAKKSKKKKCKKGYKRVKGKCKKKKKSGAKVSETVSSVTLTAVDQSIYGSKLTGTLSLKKPITTIEATTYISRCDEEHSAKKTITSDGVALEVPFVVKSPPLVALRKRCRKPVSYWIVVDGIKSNVK